MRLGFIARAEGKLRFYVGKAGRVLMNAKNIEIVTRGGQQGEVLNAFMGICDATKREEKKTKDDGPWFGLLS